MTTYARYAVSNAPGERLIVLIELAHSTWPASLYYAEDNVDWTVTLEDTSSATFTATGFDLQAAAATDSGVDTRSATVPDIDLVLWRRLEALIGDEEPVALIVRLYLSSELTAPKAVARLEIANPARTDRVVTFSATTIDTTNRDAPTVKYTWANSPGLRR